MSRARALVVAIVVLLAARAPHAQTLDTTPRWMVDPVHSGASFSVKHLVVSTVRGKLGPITRSVWYDGTNVSSVRADVTIDVKQINSGDSSRDADLRGADFFAVSKYPTLSFKSKRVLPGTDGHFQLVGDLTMHGVTKEVTLDVERTIGSIRGAARS